jgi:hypothetical protein
MTTHQQWHQQQQQTTTVTYPVTMNDMYGNRHVADAACFERRYLSAGNGLGAERKELRGTVLGTATAVSITINSTTTINQS